MRPGRGRALVGDLPAALEHSEHGKELYRADEHHALTHTYGGHDAGVCSRNVGGLALWLLGYPERARERADEALVLARELEHPVTLAEISLHEIFIATLQQDARAVGEHAEALMELATTDKILGYQAVVHGARGWALFERGEVEEGLALMREAASSWLDEGIAWSASLISLVARAWARQGEIEEGLELLTEALKLAQRDQVHWSEAELHREKGALLLARAPNEAGQAEVCFNKALEVARTQSAKSLELRAAVSLARLWQRQGKVSEARDLLAPIYNWFTEGFGMTDLKEAKALLDELA